MANQPGTLPSRDSSTGLIRSRSFVSSSPPALLPRRRWSGPRAWRTGKRPGAFPTCFPAPWARPQCRDPASVTGSSRGGPLSIDLDLWVPAHLTVLLGLAFIIPTPWVIVMYCKWIVSCVHVPGRSIKFTGRPVTLMWYFAALVFIIIVGRVITPHQRRLGYRSAGSLLAAHPVVRRQHQFERTTARFAVLGLILGILGLDLAGLRFHDHDHRLGVGLYRASPVDVPSRRRHPSRGCFQRDRARVLVALGGHLDRVRLHHPNSLGDALVHQLAGVTS